MNNKSKCCSEPVKLSKENPSIGETFYYICTKCNEGCDLKPEGKMSFKTEIEWLLYPSYKPLFEKKILFISNGVIFSGELWFNKNGNYFCDTNEGRIHENVKYWAIFPELPEEK